MQKFMIQKGNLFNQLEDRIDIKLIDSSQYDLQINQYYYRIRYIASEFEAKEVILDQLIKPKYSKHNIPTIEIDNFRLTDFYRKNFLQQYLLKSWTQL